MSKLTIDQLRDLYVHTVRTHETEMHLKAKAHRQARENFDALLGEVERKAHAQGWLDAIAAVNGQFAEGMADMIREARAQALRDAADEIQVIVDRRYQAAATDQVRAWLRGRAEQQLVPPAPMDWGETP